MPSLDALILSAGKASRFGVPKFLLPAGAGHVLLTRVLEQALQVAGGRIGVVLGREAGVARYALECWLAGQPAADRVFTVLNRRYRHGQSTSLKAGIRMFQDAAGILVFLADMPALDSQKLQQLADAIAHRGPQTLAVVAAEQGQIRPPVFLARALFAEIRKLTGDQGARGLLKAHEEAIERVEWGSGPWFWDVDDWSTYQKLAWKMGWVEEPFAPILEASPVPEIQMRLDAVLASEAVPWLSPGLLLLRSKGETRWLKLSPSYRGVREVILGPAHTPAAYLQLLRRASLAVLANNRCGGM